MFRSVLRFLPPLHSTVLFSSSSHPTAVPNSDGAERNPAPQKIMSEQAGASETHYFEVTSVLGVFRISKQSSATPNGTLELANTLLQYDMCLSRALNKWGEEEVRYDEFARRLLLKADFPVSIELASIAAYTPE